VIAAKARERKGKDKKGRRDNTPKSSRAWNSSSRPSVCVSAQLPWHVKPSIYYIKRGMNCKDMPDVMIRWIPVTGLRRKSSKDLLLCAMKR
jgi:hypothetical protein